MGAQAATENNEDHISIHQYAHDPYAGKIKINCKMGVPSTEIKLFIIPQDYRFVLTRIVAT